MHAMREPRQEMDEFNAATARYESSMYGLASIDGLAGILHMQQDSYAGGHQGGQFWYGMLGGLMRPPASAEHFWRDMEIDQRTTDAVVRQGTRTILDYQSRCGGCIGRR